MPLKIELKAHESIIVGEALITNDGERTRFYVDGDVPILREKFILRQTEANTPCKRLYLAVQQMYLSKGQNKSLQDIYFDFVNDIKTAAPSLAPLVNDVNDKILTASYYEALKSAKILVKQEEESFGAILNK